MSLLRGSCSAVLDFALQRCWEMVADVEGAPRWQRTLEAVTVEERDPQGRPFICNTVSGVRMLKVQVRVRVEYSPPHQVSFTQVQSDDLEAMESAWELEALDPGRTRATYRLALDPGPVGLLARPLERALRPLVMGHQAQELAEALAAQR